MRYAARRITYGAGYHSPFSWNSLQGSHPPECEILCSGRTGEMLIWSMRQCELVEFAGLLWFSGGRGVKKSQHRKQLFNISCKMCKLMRHQADRLSHGGGRALGQDGSQRPLSRSHMLDCPGLAARARVSRGWPESPCGRTSWLFEVSVASLRLWGPFQETGMLMDVIVVVLMSMLEN